MTTFITYDAVCAEAAENKENKKIRKFYQQKNFKEAFKLIFGFKESYMAEILLNNWNYAI